MSLNPKETFLQCLYLVDHPGWCSPEKDCCWLRLSFRSLRSKHKGEGGGGGREKQKRETGGDPAHSPSYVFLSPAPPFPLATQARRFDNLCGSHLQSHF